MSMFAAVNGATVPHKVDKEESSGGSTPVVMWHGMGDSCCNPMSMGGIKKLIISNTSPDKYVNSLRIGNNMIEDTMNGFLMNVNKQIDDACSQIAADSKLAKGYHAIGFSQGGQFLRAVAQRCPNPPMLNLVSIGGQHQGVYGFPRCPGTSVALCDKIRELLNLGAYLPAIQNNLVQAEYWQDPLNNAEYIEKSVFLAEINNEKTPKNETYKTNLQKLKNFVMVKFLQDSMVQPRDSEWFGFYELGQSVEIQNLTDSKLYKDDYLGLKAMNDAKKLHFLSFDGDHLQFTEQWFIKNIIPYLM